MRRKIGHETKKSCKNVFVHMLSILITWGVAQRWQHFYNGLQLNRWFFLLLPVVIALQIDFLWLLTLADRALFSIFEFCRLEYNDVGKKRLRMETSLNGNFHGTAFCCFNCSACIYIDKNMFNRLIVSCSSGSQHRFGTSMRTKKK